MTHYRATYAIILCLALVLVACGRLPAEGSSSAVLSTAQPAPTVGAVETAPALADLPRNQDGYVDLQPAQLQQVLEHTDVTLVNVHVPYEGELPNTDLLIPFDQIQDHTAELPAKDALIVLYCRSGAMSTQAAKTLVGLGYTQIYELDGGFNAWRAAGYKLLDKR